MLQLQDYVMLQTTLDLRQEVTLDFGLAIT